MALRLSQQAHTCLMGTNGETDNLQHDLFVKFVSYACTRITMNTYLSDKNLYFLHGFSAL